MTCPVCGGATKVADSLHDSDEVVRKRMCKACGHVFCTIELESDDAETEYVRLRDEKWKRFHELRQDRKGE